jgi:3-hydroxyacyl-[acyl-carrier-protein] dehydratase
MNKETAITTSGVILEIEDIKRLLPHRAPFLMIDRLSDIVPGVSAVGWKGVTINEPHFAGHFPDYAVMPGVLIVEAMAQAAGALVVHTLGLEDQRRAVYFMTIDKARFRRPVHPGALLRIPVKVQQHRGPVWRFKGMAYVGDELCAEAEYSAMLTDQILGVGPPRSAGVSG